MKEAKSAVSFIYIEDSAKNPVPNGTCFFVSVNSKTNNKIDYPYLVTAKHVLQKNDGTFFPSILIRMNTIDSSSKFTYLQLTITGSNRNVFFHSDPSVDLAVIPYIRLKKITYLNILVKTF